LAHQAFRFGSVTGEDGAQHVGVLIGEPDGRRRRDVQTQPASPVQVPLGRHHGRPDPLVTTQLQESAVEFLVKSEEIFQVDPGDMLLVQVRLQPADDGTVRLARPPQ